MEACMAVGQRATRFVWIGVIVLATIGVAAATRRAMVLFWPGIFAGKFPPAAALDIGFAKHAALTQIHIIPAALFLVLTPLQFVPSIRMKHLQVHRWLGRILVVSGAIIRSFSAGDELHNEYWRSQRNCGDYSVRHPLFILSDQGL